MILVTGAAGLTGSFAVEELLRRGHSVRALCRTEASAKAVAPGAEVVLGDLGDPDSLTRAAKGALGIVHAACTFTDSAIDVAAMRALLEGWHKGPFVFVSTLDVYGLAGAGGATVDEDTPLGEPFNDYGRGKVLCERLLTETALGAGRSDYVMLRAPYIWGPHPTAYGRLVAQRLREGRPVILPGAENAPDEWAHYRDAWVDVRDLATIIAECVARPAGGPLNVLTGHFAWHDLYEELIRLTNSQISVVHKPLDAIADDELPQKHIYAQKWHFSEARLARHLGALPRRPFHLTVRDTVAAGGRGGERPEGKVLLRHYFEGSCRSRARKAATFSRLPHAVALQNLRRWAFVRSTNQSVHSAPPQRFTSEGSSSARRAAICEATAPTISSGPSPRRRSTISSRPPCRTS